MSHLSTVSDSSSNEVEIIDTTERIQWEMGHSRDDRIRLEADANMLEEITQAGRTVEMMWDFLKDSQIPVAIYYRNEGDASTNVLGDGYCGYRAYDAVRKGLSEHTQRLDIEDMDYMIGQARQGSTAVVRCMLARDELCQGKTHLDEVFWFNRRDFANLICPVSLHLWMVSYNERFNVLIGVGEQGRYMETGDQKIMITRNRILQHQEGQGRSIVYAHYHFFLGINYVTVQRFDEGLFQLAQRMWSRRLGRIQGLAELLVEVNQYRDELYHLYYPP
jgi:hypothetical protein